MRTVELTTDVGSVATERLQLVPAKLGPRLGKDVQQVIKAHKAGDWTVDGDAGHRRRRRSSNPGSTRSSWSRPATRPAPVSALTPG